MSMNFILKSDYKPAGDQPKAIDQLEAGLQAGEKHQTLLGVTGSGKTFTMANVIQRIQRPTLVIAHNKTLAAQLCNEFREFFPDAAVEYFVSYYDYYQPEAYMPRTDTYIEKESQINEEIDRLRHAATQALLSRRDVIIVASVSCIYGLGSPVEYERTVLHIKTSSHADSSLRGGRIASPSARNDEVSLSRTELLRRLIDMQFQRTNTDLTRGHFRGRGDVLELMPMNEEKIYRLIFDGDSIGEIFILDPVTRKELGRIQDAWIFPAKHYVVSPVRKETAMKNIKDELDEQLKKFDAEGKVLEAERLSRRTRYDLEMIKNIGFCSGIENYSRHFDGRSAGEPPYTLMDYFPRRPDDRTGGQVADFLTIIDESHVTVSQIGGMYEGDRARKTTLVDHGFRLPSAKDNRPLTFEEFEGVVGQTVYVSATPGKYEMAHSARIVEQIIRPTGLVDPEVNMRPVISGLVPIPSLQGGDKPTKRASSEKIVSPAARNDAGEWAFFQRFNDPKYAGQVADLVAEIKDRAKKGQRSLATTLTKKMAEDLTEYLLEQGVKVQYLHSDVETLDRITILSDLRKGTYDAIVGVNLLREGLDLPEVTLVAILDADKEGFLRSETSIIQTIGRAARHVEGRVILYADNVTGSLARALKETNRRRKIQVAYNEEHGITPKTIIKSIKDIREMLGGKEGVAREIMNIEMTAEPHEIAEVIVEKTYDMKEAARKLDFETAAILRDELVLLKKELGAKEKRRRVSKPETPESRGQQAEGTKKSPVPKNALP